MSKIEEIGSKTNGNVLELFPDSGKSGLLDEFDALGFDFPDNIQFGASTPLKGRKVSASDQEEAADAGRRALNSFRNFASTPEGSAALATALDGLDASARSQSQQGQLDLVTGQLQQDRSLESDLAIDRFLSPTFRAVKTGDQTEVLNGPSTAVLPDGLDAALIGQDTARSQVLLSADLGFRDLQLAAQDMIAEAFAQYADANGVPLAPGNVASRLADAVRGGNGLPSDIPLADAPAPAIIRVDGKLVEARSQRPTADLAP